VGGCRKALEVIKSESCFETEASYPKLAQEIGNTAIRQARTKEKRLNAMQAVFRLLTHIPHHARTALPHGATAMPCSRLSPCPCS
jgi:hypothetical protein